MIEYAYTRTTKSGKVMGYAHGYGFTADRSRWLRISTREREIMESRGDDARPFGCDRSGKWRALIGKDA